MATATKATRPTELPIFRPFQLATLADKVPQGDGWLFEMKYDGYRCQAAISGGQVKLYSRRGHDWTRQFGFVAPDLANLTDGTLLLDGEMCAFDEAGRSDRRSRSAWGEGEAAGDHRGVGARAPQFRTLWTIS